MDNNFNNGDRFPHSRTSVIVRKSPDEALHVQSRSHQWSSNPYYTEGSVPPQGHQGGMLSPQVANFPSRFPPVLPNQRSPYYQQVNHYSRRNDDRLTFHSYQNYNAPSYPSSGRPSGGYPPPQTNSSPMPAQQMEPNIPNWAYQQQQSLYNMNRQQQKSSPPKPNKHVQEHYSQNPSYAAYNNPPTPPTPPLDLPSDINLSEFEERLAQPSALLKKFATESLKSPMIGKDLNNQNETPSKSLKISEDTNLRIDIDEIFSKFSHLANYSTPNIISSQEESMETSALLSDGSLSPALEEEVESPIDSDKFCQASRYNNSAMLKNKHELSYNPNNDLNVLKRTQNDEKQDCASNIAFNERECDVRMRSFDNSNANEQNNETVKDEKRPVSDCNVCGDRAIAHMHYGGICCYSCKAFFRRAVQNGKDKTYKCKKDSDCEVSVNTRRGCQKCRFEKCQDIGMTASWVLSDEQCEIRFGKGKLKRKPDKSGNTLDEEVPMSKMAVKKTNYLYYQNPFTKEDELTVVHLMCVYEASKEMIHFSDENIFLWDKVFGKTDYSANEMNSLVATVIKKNIFMMGDNPFFKNISFNDRKKLLSKNMTEMCHVRGALRFNTSNKSFEWYYTSKDKHQNGSPQNKDIGEDAIKNLYSSTEAARDIMNIMDRIASLHLPTEVILILMHVVVFSGDGLELDNTAFIQDTQTHYLSMVYRYLLNKLPAEDVHKNFSKVMAVLVELRESGDKSNRQKIKAASYARREDTSSASSSD